jgi:replicative DNA helicase
MTTHVSANAEAEMAVLGSMLLGGRPAVDRAGETLSAADFYWGRNGVIFDAMASLVRAGKPVDAITLRDTLGSAGRLSEVGGQSYLMELAGIEFTTANLPYYAGIVRDKAVQRRLLQAAREIADDCAGAVEDIAAVVAGAERKVAEATGEERRGAWVGADEAAHRAFARLSERHERGGGLRGLSTGLSKVDMATGGLAEKELIILAARPAMGKTACAATIALNVAKRGGVVAFFSLEMSESALFDRLVSAEARVDLRSIGTGRLSEEEWQRCADATARLRELPLFVDDCSDYCPSEIERRARGLRSERGGLDLVIVDYLQYVAGERGKRYGTRNDEVTDIVKGLKQTAKRLGVPVLALAQLSRAVEKREDKRPLLSDLRDSGGLEQEADIVAFLYRASYYAAREDAGAGGDPPDVDEVEFIVAKHRNGPTGFGRVGFLPRFTRFETLAEEAPPHSVGFSGFSARSRPRAEGVGDD